MSNKHQMFGFVLDMAEIFANKKSFIVLILSKRCVRSLLFGHYWFESHYLEIAFILLIDPVQVGICVST